MPPEPRSQGPLNRGSRRRHRRKTASTTSPAEPAAPQTTGTRDRQQDRESFASGARTARAKQSLDKLGIRGSDARRVLGDPKFGNMVSKLSDDKASPLEKAGAILGFGVPAGGAMAEIAPKLQDEMGKVNGSLGLAHNAVTLIDPKATGREKADAGLKLFGNAATTLDALKGFKHKQAEEIGQEARNVENAESRKPGETKPEETKDGKMPGELCYLARVGVGLNTADAALGDKGQVCTLQPASGVEFTNS